ncbi:MAG: tRNA threonylcarbamoyladenosine dehydratase [Planctomycetota bacterium]|jgi:tRNA A37 threonylcarbamoyladenosine dehydratase
MPSPAPTNTTDPDPIETAPDGFADRFGGIQRLYGRAAAERLRQAHVAVIGIGGVGSWAAEALARTGVGRITLVDLDDVCTTNVNRQVHAVTGQIGRPKVEAMAERIDAISPDCHCEPMHAFFNKNTADRFFAQSYDVIIDAIDAHYAKCLLIETCHREGVPLITCGGAGGLTDPTRVQLLTQEAQAVRHRLRLLAADPRLPRARGRRVRAEVRTRRPTQDGLRHRLRRRVVCHRRLRLRRGRTRGGDHRQER